MPIIVTTATLTKNLLGLVNNVLAECGERTVTTFLGQPEGSVPRLVAEWLNFTADNIWQAGGWRMAQTVKYWPLFPGVEYYPMPSNFDQIYADPVLPWHVRKLRFLAPDAFVLNVPHTRTDGTPARYTVLRDQLQIDMTPGSSETNHLVEHGAGFYYLCIRSHTSDLAGREPGTANGAEYWLDVSDDVGSAEPWGFDPTTIAAFADGTEYDAGGMKMTYYRLPVPMVTLADYPDLDDKFVECLKIGARAKLKKHLEAPDAGEDFMLYEHTLARLFKRRKSVAGGYRMRPNR